MTYYYSEQTALLDRLPFTADALKVATTPGRLQDRGGRGPGMNETLYGVGRWHSNRSTHIGNRVYNENGLVTQYIIKDRQFPWQWDRRSVHPKPTPSNYRRNVRYRLSCTLVVFVLLRHSGSYKVLWWALTAKEHHVPKNQLKKVLRRSMKRQKFFLSVCGYNAVRR